MPLCANRCGKDFSEFHGWWIEHAEGCPGGDACEDPEGCEGHTYRSGLCFIDCLLDFAWKIKAAQPKLSKSRTANNA